MFKKVFSKQSIILLFCFSFFAFQVKGEEKELKLNGLFTDHLVLQQNERATFWGENLPNEKVILKAKKLGIIPSGKELLDALEEHGFWLSQKLKAGILDRLDE